MVSIGGYNLDIFGGAGSIILSFFWGVMIFIAVAVIIYFFYRSFRNKAFYTHKATLTILYDNGTKRTVSGLRGGRFVNRHGVWDFKIKIPKQLKKKELGYMPDFSKADADNTLHFITAGDNTIWQQVTHKLIAKEAEVELLMRPVRTDVKTVTVNSLKNWSEMVNKNKVTVFAIGLGMFVVMVIAHLISLYVQTKIRCGSTP